MSVKGKHWLRMLGVLAAVFAGGASIIAALALAWYKDSWQGSFHWFDDSAEWLWVDKLGHLACNFHFASVCFRALCWAGLRSGRALWVGSLFSWSMSSSVEIMDGFVQSYGASVADLAANTLGMLLFVAQQRWFAHLRIFPKMGFWPSGLAPLRPEMLGANWLENFAKDYSGQTHWLTCDVNALWGRQLLPRWLVLCVGYKATGLLGGHDNVWQDSAGHTQDYTHIARAQRWYLSIDLHPDVLRTKRYRWLDILSYPLRWWLKLPAPTVELGERGLVWHWLYI